MAAIPAIPANVAECTTCFYKQLVEGYSTHATQVLSQHAIFFAALYNSKEHKLSWCWFLGGMALTIILRIVLFERTFSAFTLLYDYHVRTRVCGIHWPKEKDAPIFLFLCGLLSITMWHCSDSEEASTWMFIACILAMLVVIRIFCYDSFRGLQAWKTTNTNFKRLQLVTPLIQIFKHGTPQKIVVLFSSNVSGEFRSNSKGVLKDGQFRTVTTADLQAAQEFMKQEMESNADHPWIETRRAIIKCITIKGFDPKTPWEWVIWIPSSIWNRCPSPKDLKGAFRGPSWRVTCAWCLLLLPCGYGCLHWYPHWIQSWQSPDNHAWCNSDWYQNQCKGPDGKPVDSNEFFHAEMKRFGFIPGEHDTVFYWAWIVKHFSPFAWCLSYWPTMIWFLVYLGLPFALFIHNYCCEKPA